ncbi:unnamed protein product [Spirodela intermedia]|uniref:Uncharacterized protein n=1 Tax=Spirodela intermedia TaxID=51605 RepID=A0A7I8K501_SPIIN|nr:unnamed protein product [Spirodela intermedia]
MEEKRVVVRAKNFLPMMLLVAVASSAIPSSSSLRDPFLGLPIGDGDDALGSGMNCCNECVCVDPWCVCSDRSRFGCFKGCGFCQCYDKPERTCYCVDVLKKCPPPCILTPDGPSPPPVGGW